MKSAIAWPEIHELLAITVYQKGTLRESESIYTAACQGQGYTLLQLSKRLQAGQFSNSSR
jgi:hypothetical protein